MSSEIDPAKLKVVELRAELGARGLDSKGNKAILVKRLKDALEKELKKELPDTSIADTSTEDLNISQTEESSADESSQKDEISPSVDIKKDSKESPEKIKDEKVETSNIEENKEVQLDKVEEPASKKAKMDDSPDKTKINTETVKTPEEHKDKKDIDEKAKDVTDTEEQISDTHSNEENGENADESLKDQSHLENAEEPMETGNEHDVKEKKDEVTTNDGQQRGDKRKRSPTPSRSQRRRSKSPIKEDEPAIDNDKVQLNWYDSDLHMQIDKESFLSGKPYHDGAFGYIWSGARATHGANSGKVCYEIKITEELKWEDFIRQPDRGRRDRERKDTRRDRSDRKDKSSDRRKLGEKQPDKKDSKHKGKDAQKQNKDSNKNNEKSQTKNDKSNNESAKEEDKTETPKEEKLITEEETKGEVKEKDDEAKENVKEEEETKDEIKEEKSDSKQEENKLPEETKEEKEEETKELLKEEEMKEEIKQEAKEERKEEEVKELKSEEISAEKDEKMNVDESEASEKIENKSEEETMEVDEVKDAKKTDEKEEKRDDKETKHDKKGKEEKTETKEKELPPIPTHLIRIGWSSLTSGLQLGESKFSYGYESSGKFVSDKQFSEYGKSFAVGDVVGAYLEFSEEAITIKYTLNGEELPVAVSIPKSEITDDDFSLFPHVLSRNYAFEVNLGGKDEPFFKNPETLSDYIYVDKFEDKVQGPTRPETRADCEVIMMCGLPGSGKTHWVKEHVANNPDKRYTVIGNAQLLEKMTVNGNALKSSLKGRWNVVLDKLSKCLNKLVEIAALRRRNYVIDQTNVFPSAQRRKMRPFEGFKRRAVIVVCGDEEQARRRSLQEAQDGKDVPNIAVYEMKANMSLPKVGDWLEEVTYVELDEQQAKTVVQKYNKEGKDNGFGPFSQRRDYKDDRARWHQNRNQRNDYRGRYKDRNYPSSRFDRGSKSGGWQDRSSSWSRNDRRDSRGSSSRSRDWGSNNRGSSQRQQDRGRDRSSRHNRDSYSRNRNQGSRNQGGNWQGGSGGSAWSSGSSYSGSQGNWQGQGGGGNWSQNYGSGGQGKWNYGGGQGGYGQQQQGYGNYPNWNYYGQYQNWSGQNPHQQTGTNSGNSGGGHTGWTQYPQH